MPATIKPATIHPPRQSALILIAARFSPRSSRYTWAILSAEEAKWAALLVESSSWRTNSIREVRHKALQVAQKRIQTALNRLIPKAGTTIDTEIAFALEKVGL